MGEPGWMLSYSIELWEAGYAPGMQFGSSAYETFAHHIRQFGPRDLIGLVRYTP